jgi:WbqC-like protein family
LITKPDMSHLVAIHQPNFFPWLGYFDKIRRADRFIFLDAVDYPRSGSGSMGSWCNRVRLNVQGEARWITCPVQRMPLGAPILSAIVDDTQPWRAKLLKTLDANYRKAPRYSATMDLIEPLIRHGAQNLAAFNIAAITGIARHLGLETPLLRQSELPHQGASTPLLISLVKAAGGDAYLAGGGAAGYQEDHLFDEAGVKLVYQDFKPQPYGDPSKFVPGLSIIDYLMQDGRKLTEAVDDK